MVTLCGHFLETISTVFQKVTGKFASGKTLRAKIHAWLAARDRPRQMGAAIEALDLDIDGDLCTRFTDWLGRLFARSSC